MAQHDSSEFTTFISRFNRVLSVITWCMTAGLAAVILLTPGGLRFWPALVPLASIAAAAYVVLWAPSISVDDRGIVIDNVSRRITVPWAALIHVDTRYALTVHVPGKKYSAWAAPAPGAISSARVARGQRKRLTSADGSVRPSDLPGSDSGDAAGIIHDRWAALRRNGAIEPGIAEQTPVTVRWNIVRLTILVGGGIVSLVALSLGF